MSSRVIDTTLHDLTAPQVTEQLLRFFSENRDDPVVLFTERGDGKDFVQRVRCELSRGRKIMQAAGKPMKKFGFKAFGPFQFKLDGVNIEGFSLQFRVTAVQHMRNLAGVDIGVEF